MTSKAKKALLGTLAVLAGVVVVGRVYQLGYHQGERDALAWDFSAIVDGKLVRVGRGSDLLRGKLVLQVPTAVNRVDRVPTH